MKTIDLSDFSIEAEKLRRLSLGQQPRVLDLFSGCGGLSLGMEYAGHRVVAGVDSDLTAIATHHRNFPTSQSLGIDLTAESASEVAAKLFGAESAATSVDILVGGPPCQAFARIGRSKLREVAEHPEAFKLDNRAGLYQQLLNFVSITRPLVIVIENVPDFLNFGGLNLAASISRALEKISYIPQYTLLNSVFFGVPQMRERVFLVATHQTIERSFRWPSPTNFCTLPRGYDGSKKVALKPQDLFSDNAFYVTPPLATRDLPAAVSARDAISDLPRLTAHLNGGSRRGARRFTELIPYPRDVQLSAYATMMRNWPKFESDVGVVDHVIRHLPRDFELFRVLDEGDQYPEAHKKAIERFEAFATLNAIESESEAYEVLRKRFVPPYSPSKFPNKWRKMESHAPARTLMAHLGKDSYSHIHYDNEQGRTISVREAARLQSFPDGFAFCGTMNPAFRQIGNAVPPLLAAAVARSIGDVLGTSD